MEPLYTKQFYIHSYDCDPYQRIKPSAILNIMQEVAGAHCKGTVLDWENLMAKGYFFAIIRQNVHITRLPRQGETVTVETWPGPTTRVAFPRNTVCCDGEGNELFRAVSVWVLMDVQSRAMVRPGKSGISVPGLVRGGELAVPGSLMPGSFSASQERFVRYTELDRNGHMNNCRNMDWVMDLLPSAFHREHPVRDFTVCYLSEGHEGDRIGLNYELAPDGMFCVEASRAGENDSDAHRRVFAARVLFG